jgi:hypothetical protein
MSRYCPCGFDFEAAQRVRGGPHGRLGGCGGPDICSYECLAAFRWLTEEDPDAAKRLAQHCGPSSGPTSPTLSKDVIALALEMRAALYPEDVEIIAQLHVELGLPTIRVAR